MFWWTNGLPVLLTSNELNELLQSEGITAPWLRTVGDPKIASAKRLIRERISAGLKASDSQFLKYVHREASGKEAMELAPQLIAAHGQATGVTDCYEWSRELEHDYPGDATGYVDEITVAVFGRESWAQVIRRIRFGKTWIPRVLDVSVSRRQWTDWPGNRSPFPSRVLLCAFEIPRSKIESITGSAERFDLVAANRLYQFRPDSVIERSSGGVKP